MVKVYIELTARKSGLTQVGFLNGEPGEVIGSNTLRLPFSLTDEFLADEYCTIIDAIKAANAAAWSLSFGYFESVKIEYKENSNECVRLQERE